MAAAGLTTTITITAAGVQQYTQVPQATPPLKPHLQALDLLDYKQHSIS
jgi:hypothetical protein